MPISYKMTDLERKAWNFAERAHDGVTRKFGGEPYFEHVRKVFRLIKKAGDVSKESGAAAILHDVVEDTDYLYEDIKKEFGIKVANLVKELTSDTELLDAMGKPEYILDKMATMSDQALTIKLCDRFQNISDHYKSSQKFKENYYTQTKYIIEGLKANRQLTRQQKTVIGWIDGILGMMKRRYKLNEQFIKKFENFYTTK